MGAVPLKWLVLLVITVQTTALVLVMRYSRANSSGPAYFASTAVLLTEAAKFTVVLITLWLENGRSVPRTAAMLRREIFSQPRDTAQLAVPSFLYTIQNNLVFVALTNLDAPTFQVLYQLKILVTALMSSMMLNRRVRPVQWAALLILVVGVCLVQLDKTSSASDARQRHNNQLVGLLAVLALCMSSGYAGVFFERVLKNGGAGGVTGGASKPLSIRNMQLSLFSLPFGAAAAAINDGTAIAEHGFFYGYTRYTWAVIILQALGGLAVSATVKYADNILKGFATSISILLSVLISWAYLGDVSLSGTFGAGALLVVGATFLYSYSPPAPASSPQHRPAAAAATAASRAKVE